MNKLNSNKKPNILIFMSDDEGPWAMNCAGTPELATPNLDRLAQEGIRFDNFFCASPVCSPARASFLTGRMPSQHGIHDWIKRGNMIDPEGRTYHGPEHRTEYLEGLTGFTDILADNDYTCGIVVKSDIYWVDRNRVNRLCKIQGNGVIKIQDTIDWFWQP